MASCNTAMIKQQGDCVSLSHVAASAKVKIRNKLCVTKFTSANHGRVDKHSYYRAKEENTQVAMMNEVLRHRYCVTQQTHTRHDHCDLPIDLGFMIQDV